MNKSEIIKEFQNLKSSYNRLGSNIIEALKAFLEDESIAYLEVSGRTKKFDSFYEKIDRKKYDDPFNQIEDVCGIRVICYYATDIIRINEIIKREFQIVEESNKEELLGLKEFAYRSQHFIVKINPKWNEAPNYRKLENLKAEIQVRTIFDACMG